MKERNKTNDKFKKFTETGKISDYLNYIKEKKNNNDDRGQSDGVNRRNSYK